MQRRKMTKKKSTTLKLEINITDWNEDYIEKEPDMSSGDEIIQRTKEGMKPSEAGRHIIVAREHGDAPNDIIQDNKYNVNLGAAVQVSRKIAKHFDEVHLTNGKDIKIRSYVCPVRDGEIDAVVDFNTLPAYQNAVSYLLNTIPGHVYGRLAIIASHTSNGEVREYADQLIMAINEVVDKLSGEVGELV